MDLAKFVGSKIKELRENRKMTQEDLAKVLDTTRQSISRYEKGQRKAGQDELFELSDFFDVSIDYFFPTTTQKTEIQNIYDQLHTPRQQKVYDFAQYQLDEQNKLNDTNSVYLVGHTAAGLAIDYGQFNIEKIKATVPKGADYAVLVHGDSMEPLIQDGQIIFYREQPMVENGEIAIVELNGEEVTCKKFYHEEDKVILKSINPAYDDMVITENIRVIGKVII